MEGEGDAPYPSPSCGAVTVLTTADPLAVDTALFPDGGPGTGRNFKRRRPEVVRGQNGLNPRKRRKTPTPSLPPADDVYVAYPNRPCGRHGGTSHTNGACEK